MRPEYTASLALLVLALAAPLAAQERKGRAQQDRAARFSQRLFDTADRDGDGKLSKDEYPANLRRAFARIDRDGDGFATREEDLAWRKERLARGGQRAQRQRVMTTEQLLRRAPEGVTIEPDIAYRQGASKRWRLDLVRPSEPSEALRPGLVFVHGGGWRSGDKRRGPFLGRALDYAQKGYVCITVNYRLVQEAPFPACVEDVKCAVRWLRAHATKYGLDPERIGGYGNSAGAHLVAMLGLAGPDAELEGDGPHGEHSSLLQAVCASATPTDFTLFRGGLERFARDGALFAGPSETVAERVRRGSPITWVHAGAPPFLLVHGTADTTVGVEHADRFVEALKKAGAKYVTYLRVDGAGHGVFNQQGDKTRKAMEEFFARALRARAPAKRTPIR